MIHGGTWSRCADEEERPHREQVADRLVLDAPHVRGGVPQVPGRREEALGIEQQVEAGVVGEQAPVLHQHRREDDPRDHRQRRPRHPRGRGGVGFGRGLCHRRRRRRRRVLDEGHQRSPVTHATDVSPTAPMAAITASASEPRGSSRWRTLPPQGPGTAATTTAASSVGPPRRPRPADPRRARRAPPAGAARRGSGRIGSSVVALSGCVATGGPLSADEVPRRRLVASPW